MIQKRGKNKKGALLIGVLEVIGIILVVGILAAIALPNFIAYRSSGSYQPQSNYVEDPYTHPVPARVSEYHPVVSISNFNTEEYDRIYENRFKDAAQNPLSTFSIDVDTASYTNVRRFIHNNRMPPKDAVRIEEMINYFNYYYWQPIGEHPFYIETEISQCPWNTENKLIHIGLQGKGLDYHDIKPSNLVFLIDTSGSMASENKLPLLKNRRIK
jgi:hypothetical protein